MRHARRRLVTGSLSAAALSLAGAPLVRAQSGTGTGTSAGTGTGSGTGTSAVAAGFPSKPVHIVVPQTVGGASDTLARVMAVALGERWGQSVVVENRPGAGGNVGTEYVAHAPADGHTLLMGYAGTNAINPSLYNKTGWDPVKDFSAVAVLATVPFALVVNPQLPATSVEQFLALARAKADGITFASAGNGSVNHLLGEMFNSAANVRMLHIPYKGAAPAITDLIGGQVQVVFTSLASVAAYVQRGQLRALAVTSATRSPAFPNVPTLSESGLKGFDVNPWFGLFAPAGTPAPVVAKINADVNTLLATSDIKARFATSGADPFATTPEKFADMLQTDLVKWAKVVKDSGAKID